MLSLLAALASTVLPVLLKLALDWVAGQNQAKATEVITQAVINAPRTQTDLVATLKKGTF